MRTHALFAAALSCAGCLSLPPGVPGAGGSPDQERVLPVGGVERRYLLFVPPQASDPASAPLPVVLAFHWSMGSTAGMRDLTGFDAIAAREGFIVAYPQGAGGAWSDLRPGSDPAVDDVAFARAILDELEASYSIDPRRIYATGLSGGGHLCNLLALRMSDRLAGVAPVCALLAEPLALLPVLSPPEPVAVLIIAGTADPIAPYAGGPVLNRGTTRSAGETAAFWAEVNGAAPVPTSFALPDADPADGTTARVEQYPAAAPGDGAEVRLLTVEGGGHTWPGGPQYLPAVIVGKTGRDFSASEEIWSFFSRQTRR